MPIFSVSYGKVKVIVGVDVGDFKNYNFCTIYYWNQDWDLQEQLNEFVKLHNARCKFVHGHNEKDPVSIYHHQDELFDKERHFQLNHAHIKFTETIELNEFKSLVACIVNFGKKSFRWVTDEEKLKWQQKILDQFDESKEKVIESNFEDAINNDSLERENSIVLNLGP
jgi:hypothetical protein